MCSGSVLHGEFKVDIVGSEKKKKKVKESRQYEILKKGEQRTRCKREKQNSGFSIKEKNIFLRLLNGFAKLNGKAFRLMAEKE